MSGQTPQRLQRRNGSPSAGVGAASSAATSASSSASVKQGPMMRARATVVPITFIRGQGSPTRNNNNISNSNKLFSPSESPVSNWNVNVIGGYRSRSQISPSSPENKSPGSPLGSPSLKDWQVTQKEKSKTLNVKSNSSPIIRRTASLDTIYLTGQWPRDFLHTYCGRPLVDESTQTPDEWEESSDKKLLPKQINQSSTDDQLDKIRQRLQRSKESSRQTSANGQHLSPIHGDHFAISTASNSALTQPPFYSFPCAHPSPQSVSRVISIPRANIQKTIVPRMRSSVEGLNQEIEKLVLKGISGNEEGIERAIHEPTPDGHRAPVADILRQTRNANTQTPSGISAVATSDFGSSGGGTPSNSPNSCCQSVSPITTGIIDGGSGSRPSSQNDGEIPNYKDATPCGKDDSKSASPEPSDVQLGTSPCINKFLAREPPDGCERVKIIEEFRKPQQIVFDPMAYLRPKPTNSAFKPSSSSAFYPPFKGYQSMATPDLAVLSPAATHPQNPSAATSIEG